MEIKTLEIRKFRSIDSCFISFNKINAIVGQNNSGKSAIIRAMNAFFNKDQEEINFIQGKHAYTPNSQPKITATFSNFQNNDVTQYCHGGVLTIQMQYYPSSKKIIYRYKKANEFSTAPQELIDLVSASIAFIYVPPNRNSAELKWEENTLIKQLIEEYLENETLRRDTLTPKFRSATKYLEDGALTKISKELEKFYSLRHKFNFSINFGKETNYANFLTGIQLFIKEAGMTHNLDDCGTGLQSLTIISLHRSLAKLRHKNIILGLEEPETNLHPQAQRELISSISNPPPQQGVAQLILTTHSTVLIDNIDHKHISLVRKQPDINRGFKSEIRSINEGFFEDNEIEEFNYYQFHQYRNSDFFYANYVIFCESKNDAEVVKHLAKKINVDLDLYGITIINIDGVNNLPYPYHIVKQLGLPHLLILDKDYFIPYLNDDLEKSRDNQGLPKYRYVFKTGNLLGELIPSERARSGILNAFKENHSKALDLLSQHSIICMNYNLEMDLLCSDFAVEVMSDKLNINGDNRNRCFLLTQRHKAIKKIDNILYTLNSLENRNLPNSYKRIKRKLADIIREI
ncbi:AAA family ATPase [Pseudomonas luteola]|uniref:ATP-dependent nuclease n=1 Tax=Pseudomonas TaxID=286 RepID=UPI003DA0FE11